LDPGQFSFVFYKHGVEWDLIFFFISFRGMYNKKEILAWNRISALPASHSPLSCKLSSWCQIYRNTLWHYTADMVNKPENMQGRKYFWSFYQYVTQFWQEKCRLFFHFSTEPNACVSLKDIVCQQLYIGPVQSHLIRKNCILQNSILNHWFL
jgi:hypothetical protein